MQIQDIKQKTILLVEDDIALNRAIAFKLEGKGYHVISVFGPTEAFEILKLKHETVDILWLDLILPNMSGTEFLAELRNSDDYKNLKVVICSVSGCEKKKSIAHELGVVDYLVKSDYKLDTLIDKVSSYA